ncbi:F-box/kelch-repeat protein At3g23880-like [Rhododendron vialii]|uniref:F-box/kelch-repeat protein At3g23880-like n=1 Tax=Rhododendron vialii TaxID=182163 RepID=UPI00265DE9A9|nr:F-box/kelch-repeat protein At3g23880-like [Rhododendron vialii]
MATGSSSTYPEPIKTNQTPRKPIPGPAEVSAPLIENLLPEIIFEILSRLPVKSLLRFRCVSKSWRSMISDPKFAKAHLSLASTNPDYAHHRLLLLSLLSHEFAVKSCSLHAVLQEHSDTAVDLDYPLEAPHCKVRIYGFCNGLACIGTERIVFLWNPCTRKSKRLPAVERGARFIMYAFGYVESIDDYKVVGFFCNVGTCGFNVEVMMYTLKTDSWRSIVEFSNCLPLFGSGICVNGVLHWTASGESHKVIVSLDLLKETFGEVLLPDYRDGHSQLMLHFVSGCLCLVCDYDGICAEVWVMKEYGIRESWTKLVVVPYVAHPSNCPYSEPLCILKNGDVLLDILTHLVRFHPRDGTFAYPTIHNCFPRFSVYPYIESLVSFDTDANNGV